MGPFGLSVQPPVSIHFVIDSRLPASARPPHLCPWSVRFWVCYVAYNINFIWLRHAHARHARFAWHSSFFKLLLGKAAPESRNCGMSSAQSTSRWLSSQKFARGDRPSGPHPHTANALFAMGYGRWLSLDDVPPPPRMRLVSCCCLVPNQLGRRGRARAPALRTARGPAPRTSQRSTPKPPAEGHGDRSAGNPETRGAIHSGAPLLIILPLVGRRAGGLIRPAC
jgi:hypothetical protein